MAEQGITVKKSENFSEWYSQVIHKAELADYTKVSGCYVLRPRAYEMWDNIKDFFDDLIKKSGVKNAYFPLFIPESLLNKEKDHVEGFTPEVAWVTHTGKTKLNERLAIRPTSETIMYDSYKNWIRSYKDLPLRLNQWCSVVRWEFKHPTPFLRTREFLWQEGHTAFANKKEAGEECLEILDYYARICEELLAVPVIKGKKSEKEKFAGADYTLSIETFLPTGKAIQGGTSHFLGQNFSKVFGISYLDESEKKNYVYQNSWGLTTRTIGVMIIMHGDDKGLVIPPKVANEKVVIVPILFKKDKEKVLKKAKEIKKLLNIYNPILDDREEYSPGWKYNEWELKGVPLRIELGPKDLAKKQVIIFRRDTGKKEIVKFTSVKKKVKDTLDDIQKELFRKAQLFMKKSTIKTEDWKELVKAIKDKKMVFAPWCGEAKCEDWIKDKTSGAKTLNIPFDQPAIKGKKCVHCGKEAICWIYFAKSY